VERVPSRPGRVREARARNHPRRHSGTSRPHMLAPPDCRHCEARGPGPPPESRAAGHAIAIPLRLAAPGLNRPLRLHPTCPPYRCTDVGLSRRGAAGVHSVEDSSTDPSPRRACRSASLRRLCRPAWDPPEWDSLNPAVGVRSGVPEAGLSGKSVTPPRLEGTTDTARHTPATRPARRQVRSRSLEHVCPFLHSNGVSLRMRRSVV
jgi:hypothetical protein